MNERIVLGLYRLSDECYSGLSWGSAGFFDVARGAGTNYIFPNRFAAHTPWYNVVK
ncbi:unnamed protein product [marine sediment metagenome]|uniref:Uncharacterized protein n=1 Tax=marine sediment metagenome TaxID=412755 RepID=X1M4N4_9ZZZZ